MNYSEAIEILSKMKAKFEKEKPAWYATATEDEKAAFEQKNADKILALECALKCIKGHKQLARAAEYITANILSEGEEQ
jgi:hypothetical protein